MKSEARKTLICFAVRQEASAFQQLVEDRGELKVLLTGMGQHNAEKAVRASLAKEQPDLVLSCGFAGGLEPDLAVGTILFAAEPKTDLESALVAAGARPGRFYCAERVASTAEEKRALWRTSGADAVEMESKIICAVCREHRIPCVTVRVILDAASQNLPLDFNLLMTPDQRMSYVKLAAALLKSPDKIGALRRFQQQSREAAQKLAGVLAAVAKGLA